MTDATSNPVGPAALTDVPPGPGALWTPTYGEEWQRLSQRLSPPAGTMGSDAMAALQRDCRHILARCAPPTGPTAGSRTGLVLGQVQSGKTMSFTGVATLARDNGFRMVVVITGISVQLLEQSADRLRRDLGIEGGGPCGWVHVPIQPETQVATEKDALRQQLEVWQYSEAYQHLKKTVLVTVMKNHANLGKLTTILRAVGGTLAGGLAGVPTLVIDDEADQASLNTRVRTNQVSPVYRHIRALRSALPNHTMLQYTATPQAPLLLNIADTLSPDFCKVLDPGADYVGGRGFFVDGQDLLVREIPPGDLGTGSSPPQSLPPSLHEAMRAFILGVAVEIAKPTYSTRSMLVHPSQQVQAHAIYVGWVRSTLDFWKRLLNQHPDNPDRVELAEEFRRSYDDLARTTKDLPPFEQLLSTLHLTMLQIRVEEVNAANGPTPRIAWEASPAWILVGGQAMDRGFTVRGLTVSYMPRPLAASGSGNADTVQQRARFFGYKRPYLGYCRVWLEGSVRHALTRYVEHEDKLRSGLRKFEAMNKPLAEWRRRFILDAAMAPTRRNVIDIDWLTSTAGSEPILLTAPHLDSEAVVANQALVDELRGRDGWQDSWSQTWSLQQHHRMNDRLGLRDICDTFLSRFLACSADDADGINARLLQFMEILANNPDEKACVYDMSAAAPRRRARTLNQDDLLSQFLQGSSPSGGDGYPGDRSIVSSSGITIQIHSFDILRPDGSTLLENVPTLAIFAPQARTVTMVTQPQGSIAT